jgi:hypothetical protein
VQESPVEVSTSATDEEEQEGGEAIKQETKYVDSESLRNQQSPEEDIVETMEVDAVKVEEGAQDGSHHDDLKPAPF